MADITFNVATDDYFQLAQNFSHIKLDKKHSSTHELVYVDTQTHDEIVIDGSKLDYDKSGVVSAGKISAIHFESSDGKHMIDVTDLKLTGEAVHTGYHNYNAIGLLMAVFEGDDTFTGSKGNDYIMGWDGNDTIDAGKGHNTVVGWGGDDVIDVGKGDDVVYFDNGYGHDTVYHFDAKGGDLIWTQSTDYTIVGANHNHDTIIEFSADDQLLLVGVKHSQITEADFYHT